MIVKVGVVATSAVFATSLLEQVAGTMGLVAGIVASTAVIVAGGRHLWVFARNIGAVVENTKDLPEFVREQRATNRDVADRLTAGDQRMSRIEGVLETTNTVERAAVSAAIEASTAPRPPRRTDPPPRTGWRE